MSLSSKSSSNKEFIASTIMGAVNSVMFKLISRYVSETIAEASGWIRSLRSAEYLLIPSILAGFVSIFAHPSYASEFIVFIALSIISIIFSLVLKREKK